MSKLEDITGLLDNIQSELSMGNQQGYRSNIHSSIRKLIMLLAESFDGMKKGADPRDLEQMASTIHQVMSAKYRKYHNLNHIFSIASKNLPHFAKLAVIFHDLVYLNVDRRIHPLLASYLKDFQIDEKFECSIPNLEADPMLTMIGRVFDFKSGQKLTHQSGLNEFLSAVVACRMLPEVFSPWELVKIVACIEATIPFRAIDQDGNSPLDHLALRIRSMDLKGSSAPTQDDINSLVTVAMNVALFDLEGFFSMDLGYFLAQTWDLILESNPLFRNPLYTVKQYRVALQKVYKFYKSLNPESLSPRFRDAYNLNQEEEGNRAWWAQINLEAGCLYLEAKLISTGVLEAIAESSGGDCPISLIIGESPIDQSSPKAPLEYYLDYGIPQNNDGIRLNVHSVLLYGREKPSGFDFKHSPLSTYLYERLKDKSKEEILRRAQAMFSGETKPIEVLAAVPASLLKTIVDAVSTISWTRKDSLGQLKRKLGLDKSNQSAA